MDAELYTKIIKVLQVTIPVYYKHQMIFFTVLRFKLGFSFKLTALEEQVCGMALLYCNRPRGLLFNFYRNTNANVKFYLNLYDLSVLKRHALLLNKGNLANIICTYDTLAYHYFN